MQIAVASPICNGSFINNGLVFSRCGSLTGVTTICLHALHYWVACRGSSFNYLNCRRMCSSCDVGSLPPDGWARAKFIKTFVTLCNAAAYLGCLRRNSVDGQNLCRSFTFSSRDQIQGIGPSERGSLMLTSGSLGRRRALRWSLGRGRALRWSLGRGRALRAVLGPRAGAVPWVLGPRAGAVARVLGQKA